MFICTDEYCLPTYVSIFIGILFVYTCVGASGRSSGIIHFIHQSLSCCKKINQNDM